MISKYLKCKNTINQISTTIDEEELLRDGSPTGYYLKMEENRGNYYQFNNIFDNYELDKIIMLCKKLPNLQGTIGNNEIDKSYRKSKVSWVPINRETLWLYERLNECVLEANESHFEYDLTRIEKLQFTSYDGSNGEFYSPHLDTLSGYSFENRKLTFVLQLSNKEEYDGGILKLHTSKEPISIVKERGLITFFPAHTLHECTPVTSGNRYTLVGWVFGPKLK